MNTRELRGAQLALLHVAMVCPDSEVSAAADVVLAWIDRKLSPTPSPTGPATSSGSGDTITAPSGNLSSAAGT